MTFKIIKYAVSFTGVAVIKLFGKLIAVFGKAQYDYAKEGGGIGDVTVDHVTNIYEGLKIKESEGKISVYDGLIDFYKNESEKLYFCGTHNGMTSAPELPQKLLDKAAAYKRGRPDRK